jgi:BlaI family transcriptional regulator, penicillinase repressor
MAREKKPDLSPLENTVMNVLWDRRTATAEDVRTALAPSQPLKDSTVRTILRRLEEKGFVSHTTEGRTYVYSPMVGPQNVASDAVRGIIERFCDGSVEDLLVGMVDSELVSADKLRKLADKIAKADVAQKRKRSS